MAKTCPASPYSEVLPRDVGSITFQQLMLIIACGCLLLTTVISSMLVYKHLTRYTRPNEQRQMVRIVVTPIVFGVLSVFSLAWYEAAQYLNPIELYYEAIALASLFLLFVEYVKPERESKESFFYQAQPNKDLTLVVGLCCFPCLKKRKGEIAPGEMLRWFNIIWLLVFSFLFIDLVLTAGQIVAEASGKYCETSLSPQWAHLWITIGNSVVVPIGVGALLAFYDEFKRNMRQHKPLWKLVSFKLIVLVNFVQTLAFSFLTSSGELGNTAHATYNDFSIGLPAFLVAMEQTLFALFFHYTFRSRPYTPENQGREALPFGSAIRDALNPFDLVRGVGQMFKLCITLWKRDERGARGYKFTKAYKGSDGQAHLTGDVGPPHYGTEMYTAHA